MRVPGGGARQRGNGATLLLAICAVLATIGAAAAEVARRHNVARAAAYAGDASCGALAVAAPGGLCTTELAVVTGHYVHTYRSSHYYRLVLRTADGAADSIELKGTPHKSLWDASPIGSRLSVQRFAGDGPAKRHVTLVRAIGLEARTEWNPAWQQGNTEVGVWFLGGLAVVFGIVLLWRGPQRRGQPNP